MFGYKKSALLLLAVLLVLTTFVSMTIQRYRMDFAKRSGTVQSGLTLAVESPDYQAVQATSPDASAFFEFCRDSEPLLVAFLQKMPKGGDLHNHPAGANYSEVYLDLVMQKGYWFDCRSGRFTKEKPTHSEYWSADDLRRDPGKYARARAALSLSDPVLTNTSVHDHFFSTFGVMPDLEKKEKCRFLARLFIRNARANVSVLELMTMPPDREIMQQTLDEMADETVGLALPRVSYVLNLDRNRIFDKEKYDPESQRTAFRQFMERAFAMAAADDRIGSLTLLAAEDGWISQTTFHDQMKAIDEIWRKTPPEKRPNINLHAGELTPEFATPEILANRIDESINLGHSQRIGHGTSIAWETRFTDLIRQMKKERTAVEMSFYSSQAVLGLDRPESHPFPVYWRSGVPVLLCTDDEGVLRTNLTLEYARAAQWYKLSYPQLKWLVYNTIEYSFVPGESLYMDGNYNHRKATVPPGSEKARLQLDLEKRFKIFETETVRDTIRLFRQ